ncbi:MAG: hypothetical protein LC687_00325 [Actinobacteria bacterium]|nr:hypothetical protein [Actinomycetota bacterium]MCA1806316.1 hypothetical protein [Actinomycetota bacterium]
MGRCANCPHQNCKVIEPRHHGKGGGLVIVSEAPGVMEVSQGKTIIGSAEEILRKTLTSVGIRDIDSIPIINAVQCAIPNGADGKEAELACHENLLQQVKQLKPSIVLALGNTALHTLTGNTGLKITQEQGKVYQTEVGVVIPAVHPAMIVRSPNSYKGFRSTVSYVVKLSNGHQVKHPGESRYMLAKAEDLGSIAYKLINLPAGHVFGVDIETTGFNPRKNRILYLGLSWDKNKTIIFRGEHISVLQGLFARKDKYFIWHNGKFDAEFLHNNGVPVRVDGDTMLMHYALNEIKGTHDLEQLAVNELGAETYEHHLKKYLGKSKTYADIPQSVLLPYLAKDCDYTRQLYHVFKPQLDKSKDLTLLYNRVLLPASRFLQIVERNGIHIDTKNIIDLRTELEKEQIETREAIQEVVKKAWDPQMYMRDTGAKTAPENFNPGSPQQMKWLLYTRFMLRPAKGMEQNTREDTLMSITPRYKLVTLILRLRGIEKRLSTYVNGIIDQIESDGKVHASYLIHGTVTGRLSSRNPNMQNIPRDPIVRNVFRASPGYHFIEADYKGAELRMLAHFSQDPFLIKIFQEGRDLHTEVAIAMYGDGYTKDQRVRAKALNFGLMYGRGAKDLAREFKITMYEAQKMIDMWFERMPEAEKYLKRVRSAVTHGKVLRSPLGRMRRFGLVTQQHMYAMQNEAANFAIQATASDMTLLSGIRMQPLLDNLGARIINLVHDSLLVEVPDGASAQSKVSRIIVATMMDTPKRLLQSNIPFEVELSSGVHWGQLKELEILSLSDTMFSGLVARMS